MLNGLSRFYFCIYYVCVTTTIKGNEAKYLSGMGGTGQLEGREERGNQAITAHIYEIKK